MFHKAVTVTANKAVIDAAKTQVEWFSNCIYNVSYRGRIIAVGSFGNVTFKHIIKE